MANWKLVAGAAGLRMESSQLRAVGEEDFTWAHLLYGKLGAVQVGIFYFPSRLTPQQTDPGNPDLSRLAGRRPRMFRDAAYTSK